ncbi:MAG TPA: hypothetical protein VFV35_00355 [Acidimicrobiales bacterium]|nr:hypothetical protein [Acidimicrobiales bacterium]
MRDRHGARARLDEIASAPAPPPRAAFVAELEARLSALNVAAAGGDVLPPPEPLVGVERRPRPRAGAGLASVVASTLAFAAVLTGGHIRADADVRLDPTRQATSAPAPWAASVSGSRAEPVARPGAEPGAGPSAGAGSSEAGELAAGLVSRVDETGLAPLGGSSSAPAAAADADEGALRASSATAEADLGLAATASAGRSVVRWRRFAGADFVAYQLWRSLDSERRTSLLPDGVLVSEIDDVEVTSYEEPWRHTTDGVRYRLVVVRADGTVLSQTVAAVVETVRP